MKNPYNFTYDEFMSFLDDAEKKASQKKRHQINESHRWRKRSMLGQHQELKNA